jgi:hypothetical protein
MVPSILWRDRVAVQVAQWSHLHDTPVNGRGRAPHGSELFHAMSLVQMAAQGRSHRRSTVRVALQRRDALCERRWSR